MTMSKMQRWRDSEHLASVTHALAAGISSATVERPFNFGERKVKRGEVLSRDDLLKIANVKELAANHFINLTLDPDSYRRDHNERSSDNAVRSRSRKSRRTLQKRRAPTAEKA